MAELFSIVDSLVDGDRPPTYSEATTTTPSLSSLRSALPSSTSQNHVQSSPSSQTPQPNLLTSPLTTHFTALPSQIRSTHDRHLTTQTAHDLDTLDLLVPPITHFLTTLPATHHAELTLVPASAVPAGWALSGAAERRRAGETIRAARVESPLPPLASDSKGSKGDGDKKPSGRVTPGSDDGDGSNTATKTKEFDEWGRFDDDEGTPTVNSGEGTFFRDEKMARRLAAYLAPVHVARREVKEAVETTKGGWFGRGKGKAKEGGAVSVTAAVPVGGGILAGQADERVSLGVRVEEVTFRRENDWGVWESLSGFGIVVSVRVRKL
ncbi:hypothetical protein OQA88_9661 [Cercophora sp. LCS_1]